MKKVCIAFARGCPRSTMDAALLVDYFVQNQWQTTTKFREADIILIGTCGVDIDNEAQSIKFLSIANKKKSRNAKLIAFGCLAGINSQMLLSKFDIIPIGKRNLHLLDNLIEAQIHLKSLDPPNDMTNYMDYLTKSFTVFDAARAEFQIYKAHTLLTSVIPRCLSVGIYSPLRNIFDKACRQVNFFGEPGIFNLRVSTGCNGLCSYCAIKFAAGPLKSQPLEKILQQFDLGISQGYKEFNLIGEDVGAYGQDIGSNIVDLLIEIYNRKDGFKIKFSDFSPKWLILYFPDLLKIFVNNRSRLGRTGMPVQSGSEKILKSMQREYTIAKTKECIATLKSALPELFIKTHIMVGFPGETEEDFHDSIKLAQTRLFDHINVYKYSDRPGTEASVMPEKVSEFTKTLRYLRLRRAIRRAL